MLKMTKTDQFVDYYDLFNEKVIPSKVEQYMDVIGCGSKDKYSL